MISIIKQPSKYTPANNPVIFQIQSDNNNIIYFEVQVKDAATDNVIAVNRYDVAPDYPNGVYLNLSNTLKNYVEESISNDPTTFLTVATETIASYYLVITEKLINTGSVISGASLTSTIFFVWDAELSRIDYHRYSQNDYVISSGATGTKFLTKAPDLTKVTTTTSNHLYFINNQGAAKKVFVRIYDKQGQLINSYSPAVSGGTMYNINVSPKALSLLDVIDYETFGSYKVNILGSGDVPLSETRTFVYKPDKCYQQSVNILWVNSLGGLDSFSFYSPQETLDVQRTMIKKHPFQISNGEYTDIRNGVFNPDEEVINISSNSTYKVTSNPLSDQESIWLKELIQAKKLFIEVVEDGSLIPISIKNSNYPVLQKRYQGGKFFRLSLEYTVTGGMIPINNVSFGEGILINTIFDTSQQLNIYGNGSI